MKVELSKEAAKYIHKQDSITKCRIKDAIIGLTQIPPQGDIKPLQAYMPPSNRLRIGKHRIIYRYKTDDKADKVLYVSEIGARGDIYK